MQFVKSKMIVAKAALAVVAGVALSATEAFAKTVTWAGTIADPASATYTVNTNPGGRSIEGFTAGGNIYNWSTSTANFSGGNYAIGDDVLFTDSFSGGTFIRLASSGLNPNSIRFANNGGTYTQYTILAADDLLKPDSSNVGSNSPFGTNHNTQLLLDTGFNGKVVLRIGSNNAGLSTGTNSNTIIRSGILELATNNTLPNNGNNQLPPVELAGGELRFNYGLITGNGTGEPSSSQYRAALTVSENSVISGVRDTTTATDTVRLWGDNGSINIAAGKTLTLRSYTNGVLRLASNLKNAANVGTLKLEDVGTFTTRLQVSGSNAMSTTAIFDLGSGSGVLETRDRDNGTVTIDLGALKGGVNTILRGTANFNNANPGTFSSVTYSIGARGDSTTFDGKVTDGIVTQWADRTGITKAGSGTLTLTNASTYTGATTVNAGTLAISGSNGSIGGSPTISINSGGSLRLDNATSKTDRIANTASIAMNRGTLEYVGNLSAGAPEVVDKLVISGGGNTVRTLATGSGASASINFANGFSRTGGVVNFEVDPTVDVSFAVAPTLDDGIIGGFATSNGGDWAALSGNKVAAYTGYTTNTAPGTWAGTLNINSTAGGTSTVAAPTTINSLRMTSGTVSIDAGQSLTIDSGGILAPGTSGATIEGSGTLTAGSGSAAQLFATVPDAANTLTISSPIVNNGAGTVTLVKSGQGKLVLKGTNTMTGGLSILQGSVAAGAANIFPASADLTVDFGNTFDLATFNQTFGKVTLIDGTIATTGGPATLTAGTLDVRKGTIVPSLAGAAILTKTTSDTVTLGASNSYSGGTVISTGTLIASAAGALPTGGALTVSGGQAVLDIGASTQTVGAATLTNGQIRGTGTLNGSSYYVNQGTITAVLTGTGVSLTLGDGGQTVVLTGANTYTGVTNIGTGVISTDKLANGGTNSGIGASSNAASNLAFGYVTGAGQANGGLTYTGPAADTDRLFTLGGFTVSISASGTGPLKFTNPGALVVNGSPLFRLGGANKDDNTFAPIISGNINVIKDNGGVWVVTGNNTFTGTMLFNGGTLSVGTLANGGVASPIGASTNIPGNMTFNNGGWLKYTGPGSTTNRLFTISQSVGGIDSSGNGPLVFNNAGANVSVGSGTGTFGLRGTNTGDNRIDGILANIPSGTLSVAKSDAGKWVLNGANTYTGTTTVNAGTLQLGKNAQTPVLSGTDTTGAIIESALVLDYSGGGTDPSTTVNTLLGNSYAASSNFTSGVIRSTTASGLRALGWKNDTVNQKVTILNTFDGDATLDGKVNTLDFNLLAGSFGQTGKVWADGNFNYDVAGTVDSVDFGLLVAAYGSVLPSAAPTASPSLGSVVPEPATLSLLALGAVGLMRRRR